MGNGQKRNRRGGARSRHGPHRGGGASDRHSATHLMPPSPAASTEAAAESDARTQADSAAELDQAQAAEIAEEQFERRAGELRGGPESPAPEPEPGIEVASSVEPAAPDAPPSMPDSAPVAEQPSELSGSTEPSGASGASEQVDRADEALTPEPERRAPRGRFERFYAPGQGPRTENNGHGAGGGNGAARRFTREPAPGAPLSAAQTSEEDEQEVAPSGPREDVRGPVGELIDSLHDLFIRDRAVAVQGGAARCGICYFHYPADSLVYRESEGFYVCQSCERALGSARVSMVRRQQRL